MKNVRNGANIYPLYIYKYKIFIIIIIIIIIIQTIYFTPFIKKIS
jgi:hypothetical protein